MGSDRASRIPSHLLHWSTTASGEETGNIPVLSVVSTRCFQKTVMYIVLHNRNKTAGKHWKVSREELRVVGILLVEDCYLQISMSEFR